MSFLTPPKSEADHSSCGHMDSMSLLHHNTEQQTWLILLTVSALLLQCLLAQRCISDWLASNLHITSVHSEITPRQSEAIQVPAWNLTLTLTKIFDMWMTSHTHWFQHQTSVILYMSHAGLLNSINSQLQAIPVNDPHQTPSSAGNAV